MKTVFAIAFLLIAGGISQFACAADWADLKMTFVLKGTPPKPSAVVGKERDPICAALPILSESMLINAKNNGIQNVGFYIDTRNYKIKEIHPDLKAVPANKVVLDNKNCVFVPHVLIVRPGQTITAKNSDKTGHNCNFSGFFNNTAENFALPPGASRDKIIDQPERGVSPVDCGSHPWMKAYIIAQDHPYVGLSNADGVLSIAKLPTGKVAFRVWHENAVIDEVMLNGKKAKWDKASLELELKIGMNEYKVEVDAARFK